MDCPPLRLAAKRWIQQLQDAEATDDVMREIIELGCRYGKWSLVQDGRGPRKFKRNFFSFFALLAVGFHFIRTGFVLHVLRGCRSQATGCSARRVMDDGQVPGRTQHDGFRVD